MTTDEYTYLDTMETAPAIPRTQAAISAAEVRELRNGTIFKKLKGDFRATCAREKTPCWLCNDDIDYKLDYPHPLSWSLDHAITVKERPDLLSDPLNFRSSHHDCNQRRGTDDPVLDLGTPSETW